MGPDPNGPRSVSCYQAIRYSGLGVPETWFLLEISWIYVYMYICIYIYIYICIYFYIYI